ncbi:class I SAM-dependent methyltransferase [Streptomyces sp. NBC_01304]|uniref:class I SAM-dependent methyltransferase n=1 Tax=Streptomyces sp. NBC_01304 TaxID=2903818 RepID=UPI002E140BBE|nr:methyltransferase domain-containing protein [Streptomyces sp. NBC_01304]
MTTQTASAALSDALVFLRQFTRTSRSTGAIAPSGAALSRALIRHVHPGGPDQPRAVLEVGPGTGAVTRHLARRLGPYDTLELVEANPHFAHRLSNALHRDPLLTALAPRTRLRHGLVQDQMLGRYDSIVCGLPFANFPPDQIEAVFRQLFAALRPGGRLSFFSYAGGRTLQKMDRRQAAARHALRTATDRHLLHSELVLPNLPPARVHHLAAPTPALCRCGGARHEEQDSRA